MLLFVLALLDYIYQRYRIEQELKMSKQEVKDEMRSMEGDPKVKARRRQIAMARLKEQLKKMSPRPMSSSPIQPNSRSHCSTTPTR